MEKRSLYNEVDKIEKQLKEFCKGYNISILSNVLEDMSNKEVVSAELKFIIKKKEEKE